MLTEPLIEKQFSTIGRDSSLRRSRCSVIGPYCGATFFLGGVLEKMQIYNDKRNAIQVFIQIKDHAQQA